jgi:predicted membrane GTPase involved in stress response
MRPCAWSPRQFGLEQAMEFLNEDELVEVDAAAIGLGKAAAEEGNWRGGLTICRTPGI